MSDRPRLERVAKTGYVLLALLLAGGMVLSIRQLTSVADEHIARIRAEEHAITLVEQLRWNSELIVSAGRGYLITGRPGLLAKVGKAERRFDVNVRELRSQGLDPGTMNLVADVEDTAAKFRRLQEELLRARASSAPPEALEKRFEQELLPLRRQLSDALDAFVSHQTADLGEVYEAANQERRRLEVLWIVLLGLLVFVSLGVASYFTRRLSEAYQTERSALDTARKALSARDELMGMVAHDLRTPLGAILMKAAILERTAGSDKAIQQARSIEKVGAQMESLIKSMLDVATIEAGRFTVSPGPCEVDDLLKEASDLFVHQAASKQVRFRQDVAKEGMLVFADRPRVIQVLANLLGNAFKFTAPLGTVELTVERDGKRVRFAVRDTGPGLPQDNVDQVFDRFWTREIGGKRGTGLGLFIAKGIVDAHGGRLWVESSPGNGATFFFTLPAPESGPALRSPDAQAFARLPGEEAFPGK